MKAIIVDLARCNGCYNCQIACKDEHCGNDWAPVAAPQPMTGQFWCRVDQKERGRVPVVRVDYTPRFCGMCDDAPCLAAAKDGGAYRRDDGIVLIDPTASSGQRAIADACPASMAFFNEEAGIVQKCTGCAHLLDEGWKAPRCVDACATGALRFVEEEEAAEEIAQAQTDERLAGLGAHVYYLNVPKRFIAGTVANRGINEVVVGATVELLSAEGDVVSSAKTDEFGDFRFEDCEKAPYSVRIAVEGFPVCTLSADCTETDVVLDDVLVDQL